MSHFLQRSTLFFGIVLASAVASPLLAQVKQAQNPIIYADVPDLSMLRVGDTYYMSSTTMHMTPGVPIMKSKDLVNWQMVGYASDTLGGQDESPTSKYTLLGPSNTSW